MRIAAIREIIDAAVWNARDFDGYTRDEFTRANVPARLLPHLEALERLEIAERFQSDRERCIMAMEAIQTRITRWREIHGEVLAALPTFPIVQ